MGWGRGLMATRISGADAQAPPVTTAARHVSAAARRLVPVAAAAAVAIALATAYPEHSWVSPTSLLRGVDAAAFTPSQWALYLVLVAGGLTTAVLAALAAAARGGRRVALAGVAVPLATGLTAAGVTTALLGLVLAAAAVRWLGVDL